MTTHNLALVGLNFGRHLLKDFTPGGSAFPFFHLAAVCDLNEALARRYGEECGVPWTTSLDQLLADDSIAAIALLTGPVGRAALVDKITAAGKHIMTTKPFEADPEAAFILNTARARGFTVLMNSPQPVETRADLQLIQRWREQFSLGEPISAHSETWASYREKADGSWYDDPSKCPVAPLFRLSIYALNDLVALFGGVESASVMATRRFTERPTPDTANALLSFQNGMLVSLFASFCIDDTEPYQDSMVLHFERGTIYRNGMRAARGQGTGETMLDLVCPQGGQRTVLHENLSSKGGDYPWERLHQAVSGGTPAGLPDPERVAEALRVIDALRRAEASGATEPVIHPAGK